MESTQNEKMQNDMLSAHDQKIEHIMSELSSIRSELQTLRYAILGVAKENTPTKLGHPLAPMYHVDDMKHPVYIGDDLNAPRVTC